MTSPANKHPHPVAHHTTTELLKVLRGAVLAHAEAITDAQNFNRKIGQCVTELAGRVKREGLIDADPVVVQRLRDELAQAKAPTVRDETRPKRATAASMRNAKVDAIVRAGLDAGKGTSEIMRDLNDSGVETARGNAWAWASTYSRVQKVKASGGVA